MTFIEECRKAIGIDSSQASGTNELVLFFSSLCRESRLSVKLQDETLNGLSERNLIASSHENFDDFYELLLQSHIDTPDPGVYSFWTKTELNPYNASIYGDKIYGLGASNCKLDFLCKLEAIKKVGVKNLNKPLMLLGTYGGLKGMSGAIKLVRKTKIRSDKALIGGATLNNLVTESIGLAKVKILIPFTDEEIEFRKSHNLQETSSSQSKIFYHHNEESINLNQNAIIKLIKYLKNLPTGIILLEADGGIHYDSNPETAYLDFDLLGGFENTIVEKLIGVMEGLMGLDEKFKLIKANGYESSFIPINIGMIRTDYDGVSLSGCCRLTSEIDESKYEKWINELKKTCEKNSASFVIKEYKKSFKAAPKSDFVKNCQNILNAMGGTSELGKLSSTTEASVFSRKGMDCMIYGAGKNRGSLYSANESVNFSDLKESIIFYKRVIERYCI